MRILWLESRHFLLQRIIWFPNPLQVGTVIIWNDAKWRFFVAWCSVRIGGAEMPEVRRFTYNDKSCLSEANDWHLIARTADSTFRGLMLNAAAIVTQNHHWAQVKMPKLHSKAHSAPCCWLTASCWRKVPNHRVSSSKECKYLMALLYCHVLLFRKCHGSFFKT